MAVPLTLVAPTPIAAQDRRLSDGFGQGWPQAIALATRSVLGRFRSTPDNRGSGMSQLSRALLFCDGPARPRERGLKPERGAERAAAERSGAALI
jgi:hypothetical protein